MSRDPSTEFFLTLFSVFLFGHNPTLTDLSNYLTDEYIDNIPTCGIAEIHFDVNSWEEIYQGNGYLASLDYPKNHL